MEVGSSTLPGTTTHGREAMCTGSNAAWDYFEGGLAQLARAPALQAGGQRFESVILHFMGIEFPKSYLTYCNKRKKTSKSSKACSNAGRFTAESIFSAISNDGVKAEEIR